MTEHENPEPAPIVVTPEHLKGGTPVVCRTEEEARRVQGMDDFAQWIRTEVLA